MVETGLFSMIIQQTKSLPTPSHNFSNVLTGPKKVIPLLETIFLHALGRKQSCFKGGLKMFRFIPSSILMKQESTVAKKNDQVRYNINESK